VEDLETTAIGPQMADFDPLPASEPEPPALEPEIPPFEDEAERERGNSEALPEEPPAIAAAPDASSFEAPDDARPEPASIEGIDLAGLSAEMAEERLEQAAAADAVLEEVVAGEITLVDTPPLMPAIETGGIPQSRPAMASTVTGGNIGTFTARPARREALHRRQWKAPRLPAAILALVAANTVLVASRADIVRLLPQTASLYAAVGLPVNLRGLAFDNIKMSKEEHDGLPVLVVEGSLVNVTGRPVEVPRLRLAVRNESKNEIYTWTTTPTRSILGPGEAQPFRSRLASPPAEARDVLVRFFSRRDTVAGLN
jgi:hypothetical protein